MWSVSLLKDLEYLRRDRSCTRIRSTASTAWSAKCWIVCWTRRRRLSGDQRASPALVATTVRRTVMDLSAAITPWHIVIEVKFRGAGSNLLVRRDSSLKSNIQATSMLYTLYIYFLDTEFCFCLIGNSICILHRFVSTWMKRGTERKSSTSDLVYNCTLLVERGDSFLDLHHRNPRFFLRRISQKRSKFCIGFCIGEIGEEFEKLKGHYQDWKKTCDEFEDDDWIDSKEMFLRIAGKSYSFIVKKQQRSYLFLDSFILFISRLYNPINILILLYHS